MRRWFHFRLTTLLIAIALLAGAIALGLKVGKYVWLRYHVHRAVVRVLDEGPDFWWSVDPLRSHRWDDYVLLRSDADRLLPRFIHIVESGKVDARKINALDAMRELLARSGSVQLRAECLQRLISLLTRQTFTSAVEDRIVLTIADWVPSTGIDSSARRELWTRATINSANLTPAWAELLIALGGREELQLVLELASGHDEKLALAVQNSAFMQSHWPGLLPYVKEWIRDPLVIKSRVLDYSVLSHTDAGRHILVEFATTLEQPVPARTRAIERLQESLAGVALLLDAAQDPSSLELLQAAIGNNAVETFRSRRLLLERRNADALWTELIDGLKPRDVARPHLPSVLRKAMHESREYDATMNLKCLQLLANNMEYQTQGEWLAWFEQNNPGAISQQQIVQLVLDHPEVLTTSAIVRRIVPYHLGTIPPECVPLYKMVLRSESAAARYWGCRSLLLLTDDVEAVPFAIDLIDLSTPSHAASTHPGEIALLQQRFAVNYFWDTAAWRKWWKEHIERDRSGSGKCE